MEIKKISEKVNLKEQNIKAEFDEYKCNHDCIEYYYSGATAAKGCKRKNKTTPKTTSAF